MNFIIQGNLKDYEYKVRQRVEHCLHVVQGEKIYIYGYGMMGEFVYEQLKNQMEIEGFIDGDKNKQGRLAVDNKKIYALEDVSRNSCIIIASLTGWSAIYNKCQQLGYFHCCHYEELAFCNHALPHWEQAFAGTAESIINHWEKYTEIYNMLSDEKSKKVLENILRFRLTMDIKYSQSAYELSTSKGEKQYFDPDIIKTDDEEVFIDCGGYCGETTKDFIDFVSGTYRRIYIFEPDKNLANKAVNNLSGGGIKVFPCGVGKEEVLLLFNAIGNDSGTFSDNGTQLVKVVRIDDVIKERVSFIKMDIEGMESEALMGAQETIKTNKPKLAISVYHKCDDIFAITKQVLECRPDYRLYMRHYTPNCADTVMYFV